MGAAHSGSERTDAGIGSDVDRSDNSNKHHWPFGHEKHSKENSAPQAKQEQSTADADSSDVMTVQKFNVDDDDDSNEPSMMFQRVNNKFVAEPKGRSSTLHMSSADFGSQDTKGCKEEKEAKEKKEDTKPVISRKIYCIYTLNISICNALYCVLQREANISTAPLLTSLWALTRPAAEGWDCCTFTLLSSPD